MPNRSHSIPARETVRQHMDVLPRTALSTLDEPSALAAFYDLEKNGSNIPASIRKFASSLVGPSAAQLEEVPNYPETFVVSLNELHGLLARAAIGGSALTAYDLAASAKDVRSLESTLLGQQPQADSGPTAA